MKLYTVSFKSGGFFTVYATHFKKLQFEPDLDFPLGISKFVFMKVDRQVASCPIGHVDEIYTMPLFGTEREVVYHG